MLRDRGKFARAFALLALLAGGMPSCASILGIEDVHTDDDGGSSGASGVAGSTAGPSGAAGASGSAVGSGGSSAGGSVNAGTAGSSTAAGGSAGDGSVTSGTGGSTVDGGVDRGAGGQAPSDGGPSDGKGGGVDGAGQGITVHGTVIDYWRHRVPDVAVYLGSSTTMTDATGQFTFTNVTAPYDIGLAVRVGEIQYGGSVDAWLFRGLTRTDPTLQVKDGLVPGSSYPNAWKFQNFPGPSTNDAGPVPRTIGIAFGSLDTVWGETFSDPDGTDLGPTNIDFSGGATSAGTAHALLWETPIADSVSPTRYVAYDQQSLTIDANTPKNVTFDMTADNTPSAQVIGSVSSGFAGPIEIDGYVRFDDGAPIHVVQLMNAGTTFQMLMPTLAGSSVTVSAVIGRKPDATFAVAHLDGLTPGQGGVQLTVPNPVSLVAPAAGATSIGPTTLFQWSASPHVARMTVYCQAHDKNGNPTLNSTFNVVTEDYKTQLPSLAGATGIPLPKNQYCTWAVEIHGAYATVDAAAGSLGYFDPFSLDYYGELIGPKRDNGSFTISDTSGLTTAP